MIQRGKKVSILKQNKVTRAFNSAKNLKRTDRLAGPYSTLPKKDAYRDTKENGSEWIVSFLCKEKFFVKKRW